MRVPVFGETPFLVALGSSVLLAAELSVLLDLDACLSDFDSAPSVSSLGPDESFVSRGGSATTGGFPTVFSSVAGALTFESFGLFLMWVPPISPALKFPQGQIHQGLRIRTDFISPDARRPKNTEQNAENLRLESVCSQHSCSYRRDNILLGDAGTSMTIQTTLRGVRADTLDTHPMRHRLEARHFESLPHNIFSALQHVVRG